MSAGHRGSNKWSQRFWRPGCTWQPVSSFPNAQQTQKQYTQVGRIGTRVRVHVCSCPFPDLILPPPSFHLILLIPLCQHQAFPLMKCLGPYTVLTLYLLSFILSLSSNLSSVFPSFIVFGFLSVILQGKVIKGQHNEGALLRFVILFSRSLLFVFYFCLWQQTLSGRWAWDKPSVVLCGEIIWPTDKALWVSSSQLLLSSRHGIFLFPVCARKSQVGLGVIKPFWHVPPLIKCQPSPFDTCNYMLVFTYAVE